VYQNPGEHHRRLSFHGLAAHSAEIHPRPGVEGAGQTNTWAIVALILALFGFATYFAAPVGAVLGHVALRQIRHTGAAGRTMARGAIVVGWTITVAYSLILLVAVLWTVAKGISLYYTVREWTG
jgi:hypothetical protein